jgi:hypothetical protein
MFEGFVEGFEAFKGASGLFSFSFIFSLIFVLPQIKRASKIKRASNRRRWQDVTSSCPDNLL